MIQKQIPPGTACIDSLDSMLSVTIPVMGDMVKGDTITVTFHNVMVQALEATEPAEVSLMVSDDISGSNYTSSTMIEVIPPKLGNVTVTVTPDPVTAESTVDLTVRYTATKVLADDNTYGRIRVQLPKVGLIIRR